MVKKLLNYTNEACINKDQYSTLLAYYFVLEYYFLTIIMLLVMNIWMKKK
jgi:hypothetical protein